MLSLRSTATGTWLGLRYANKARLVGVTAGMRLPRRWHVCRHATGSLEDGCLIPYINHPLYLAMKRTQGDGDSRHGQSSPLMSIYRLSICLDVRHLHTHRLWWLSINLLFWSVVLAQCNKKSIVALSTPTPRSHTYYRAQSLIRCPRLAHQCPLPKPSDNTEALDCNTGSGERAVQGHLGLGHCLPTRPFPTETVICGF